MRIGIADYQIQLDPLLTSLWGCCDPDSRTISLGPQAIQSKKNGSQMIWVTLIHELCHAAMHEHGLSKDVDSDEATVKLLTAVLTKVIVDNPGRAIQLILGLSEARV